MIPNQTPVAIGSDHAGVALKATLREALEAAGHSVLDMGTQRAGERGLPDFANAVAAAVLDGARPLRPAGLRHRASASPSPPTATPASAAPWCTTHRRPAARAAQRRQRPRPRRRA
jgi:hypothetical protein